MTRVPAAPAFWGAGDGSAALAVPFEDFLAVWKPGMSLSVALQRMVSSVLMVITVSDPPRVVWHAVPLLLAGAISVLGVAGVQGARNVPLPLWPSSYPALRARS